MDRIPRAFLKSARGKLKKAVRNKPLNNRQQRYTKNAFDTMDVLEQDAFIPSKKVDPKTSTPGVSKLDAIVGSKRIRNIIDTVASDKVKSQTDGVNALLQGLGVGFAVGYDSTRDKKPVKKTKTKAPIPKKKPNRKKPPVPKAKPNKKPTPKPKSKPSLRTRVGMAKK